jgi:ATP-dependent RNA helicase RhlE
METASFKDFHLHPNVLRSLTAPSFTAPTPLQSELIPLVIAGKDIIGTAESGLQKTAAYVIPILHRLAKNGPGDTRALILTASAEAAERTYVLTERLGKNTGLKYISLYGLTVSTQQQKIMRSGVDIIIGTPGCVLDSLWKNQINLSSLETIVIDEADQMAALGLLSDIFNILMCITHKRQTLIFTATLTETIKKLSRQFLHTPVSVPSETPPAAKATAKTTTKPAAKTAAPTPAPKAPLPTPAKPKSNTLILRGIISKSKNDAILVFTRTKESARSVSKLIMEAGFQVALVRGTLPQKGSGTAPKGIPTGPVIILIVTDNASRGLDNARIFRLINDPKPLKATGEDGHIGRTGRLDENGKAFTLVTRADELILFVLEKYLDAPLEQVTL